MGTGQAMEQDKDYDNMAPGDEAPPGTEGAGENVCPECGGSGRKDGDDCANCAGTGRVTEGIGGA